MPKIEDGEGGYTPALCLGPGSCQRSRGPIYLHELPLVPQPFPPELEKQMTGNLRCRSLHLPRTPSDRSGPRSPAPVLGSLPQRSMTTDCPIPLLALYALLLSRPIVGGVAVGRARAFIHKAAACDFARKLMLCQACARSPCRATGRRKGWSIARSLSGAR
jgi:hypothetical protein